MKYPLGMVALLYAVGLLLGEFLQPPLWALFGLSFLLVTVALFSARFRQFLLGPLVLLTGWTMLVAHTAIVSPYDLRDLVGPQPAEVAVRVALCQTPHERISVHDGKIYKHSLVKADVTAVQKGTNWEPAYGRIMVFTKGPAATNIYSGQTVEISGVLTPPPLPIADGLFDYRAYLKRQGIYYELKADGSDDWSVIPPQPGIPPLADRFLAWAKKTLTYDQPVVDEPLQLLLAMTLGWQAEITNEIYAPFMQSGTMHIFAISGLHIALIAGILVAVLRVLRVPRLWSGLVVIPLIWFYTEATGWQPSAIRSTIMMTVIVGGWALNRPGNLINSLGAAAFIILLWDPQQLFQASFQLSFFVVLSIALIQPSLDKLRDRFLATDPLQAIEPVTGWRRWLRAPLRHWTSALATSFAAWLGSWELTAYYFHLFSPITLVANLVIVPLSSAALACNLGSLLCGDWLPWATSLFNHCAWFCMSAMVWFSHRAIEIPGAYFHVRAPAVVDFPIYYGMLFGLLSGWFFLPKRRIWTTIAVTGIFAFYGWRFYAARTTIQITAIPLSGGSCVYCDRPGRAGDLLEDCGNPNSVNTVVKPFLWAQGVNRLPHLLLTHGSFPYMGGFDVLRTNVPMQEIVTSAVHFKSSYYNDIITDLTQHTNSWRMVGDGDQEAGWEVLHPSATNHFPRAADNAIVLRGNFYGTRVLLLSELGRAGQRALMERHTNLQADIVITGPSYESEGLGDDLLQRLQPRLIVITDSEFPAPTRAKPEFQTRLETQGFPVLYTRLTNAVTLTLRPGGWTARGMGGRAITFSALDH